jgi:hypothetical protein
LQELTNVGVHVGLKLGSAVGDFVIGEAVTGTRVGFCEREEVILVHLAVINQSVTGAASRTFVGDTGAKLRDCKKTIL